MGFRHREHGAPTRRAQSQSKSLCIFLRDLCVRAPARLCVPNSAPSVFIRAHPCAERSDIRKSAVKNSVLLALLAVALLPACRREPRNENSDTPPQSVIAAPTTTSTTEHAEVFRRAFWRQPTSADRILNAERRVDPDDNSWQWFIQLHPGPELLAALRDPDGLGLLPVPPGITPAPWPAAPAWFPAVTPAGFEVRQSPASALTVLYHQGDNLLFATDHGAGFAPPVR